MFRRINTLKNKLKHLRKYFSPLLIFCIVFCILLWGTQTQTEAAGHHMSSILLWTLWRQDRTLCFTSPVSHLFMSLVLIWRFVPSTVQKLHPLSEVALKFRSSFKRSVESGLSPRSDSGWWMLECLQPYHVFVTMQPQPAEPRGAQGGHDVILYSKGGSTVCVTHASAQAFLSGSSFGIKYHSQLVCLTIW